ncbi:MULTISPECIES: D-isomer specific 2-hydroxyacid dehydrogenase family protein [Arthrobacter]|uniref:D-isomer specific 2-hydroxyacid dehydrogenase family protein n=1 Tax=Arthrobacter TaxID=1663 RepID=UPI0006DACED4|nr:D-isomer specific 2-hydroxyacid dehydrogenase family protein [Arthrobacter sp. Edens01]KPN19334.1 hypothetical protein AO716_05950 [Arthrobacter sp. Edens01]
MDAAPVITILPEAPAHLADAVRDGGGVTAPLSDQTTGLIVLAGESLADLTDILKSHPAIRWIQVYLAGADAWVPLIQQYPEIRWTSAKGAYGQPVGEYALTLTLAMLRAVPTFARARSWGPPQGTSLYGKRVVIVGAGGVGREILRLVGIFTPHITVVRRHDEPVPGAERTVTDAGLDDALGGSDVVILAAAMTTATRHLIDARRLGQMSPHAVLINIARGPLVDTDALVAALAEGRLAGAALDVTDPQPLPDGHPLWSEPHALISPHTAETEAMIRPHLAARVRENVRSFRNGDPLAGLVDPAKGY